MDFTKFSDENFDLKDWINGAFKAQKDTNQNLEQFVATLVTKLQVFIQEINNSVDETSQQTIQNFPRILREIEVLKQEAFMLKEQMRNVRDDLLKVEKNTVNESMKMLLDLDVMRTNLLNVQIALTEANNWSTLTADLDTVLQSQDINRISDHIEQMQTSLEQLQDQGSDYVSNCTLLEDFKNKFETLMSADIINALNSKSIDECTNYVRIFGQMDRLNELKKYYYQCERAKILERHTQFVSSLQTSSLGETLKLLLKNWLDQCVEIWHNETQWCKQIFNDAHVIVINLLVKCFEEFNGKSFQRVLEKFLIEPKNEASCLDTVFQLKQETDLFVLTIHSNCESSALLKTSQANDLLHKLFQHVYAPFKCVTSQYTLLESNYLQFQLENNVKMSNKDTDECVQLLSNSVTKVFNLIEKSVERCTTFTNGCTFYSLVEAIRLFLKNYIEEFKRIVTNLKERGNETAAQQQAMPQSASVSSLAGQGSSTTRSISPAPGVKQQGGVEDWDMFRRLVKIIQTVGDLMLKYEDLEELLSKHIQVLFKPTANATSASTTASPIVAPAPQHQDTALNLLSVTNYKEYLLEDTERFKLNSLISIVESGEDYVFIKDIARPLNSLSELVHRHAFDLVFGPVKYLLATISKPNFWSTPSGTAGGKKQQQEQNVPSFALVPHEYITKIGQYLLTLPQNLEPFTMQDSANLIVALRRGRLPYLDEKDLSDDIMACWLDSIANATAVVLCDETLKIQQALSVTAQRQLVIDMEYICSVFDDVGLKDYNHLQDILQLLKTATKDEFEAAASKNKSARIVSALRKMKNF